MLSNLSAEASRRLGAPAQAGTAGDMAAVWHAPTNKSPAPSETVPGLMIFRDLLANGL